MSNSQIYTPQKVLKPEDISLDDLRHLSKDEFALWALTSGVKVDSNDVDFNNHRYLLPIYLDNSKEVVWQKAAQLGATVYMILRILWWLESHQGRKAGLYFPTKEGVENLSKDRLTPLINSCPSIAGMADAGDKLGLRKIGTSSFYLYHLGGVASKDSVPLDYIAFDEVRLCSAQEIDQALERVSHSPYKYKTFMSTAGLPDCFSGDTTIIVRGKSTKQVEKKSFIELQDCYQNYEVLSYNRLGGYRPRWRNINAVINRGKKELVNVTLQGGHQIKCTPSHNFAVYGSGYPLFGKGSFVPVKDIDKQPKGSHQAHHTLVYSLNEIPTHEGAPYDLATMELFGLYIAEGSFSNGTLSIWQNEQNKEVRELVKEWANNNALPYNENEYGVHVSKLYTRPDLVSLVKEGGSKASEKRIPSTLLKGNKPQLVSFLHGFILGDGHIRADSNLSTRQFDLYTSSKQLVNDLLFLGLKIGTPFSISERDRIGSDVTINGEYCGKANFKSYQLSYSTGSHRNTELLRALGGAAVRSVEPYKTEDAYDISVEKDNWFFLAESGALVHNSDINARFNDGTQHVWMSSCGCPDGVDLARTFPDCVIEDPEKGLYLRCPKCKYVIKDPQNGRYVAHNPGASYHSYHVSQLVSKYISLEEIWQMWKRTTNLEEFYKAKLGLPYIDEANRGVTKEQCEAAIDEAQTWGKNKKNHCAMGVDQGAGYCMAIISDMYEDKKRIRHVEIIEQNNPDYIVAGKRVTPFNRLRELMKEFNVRLCVVDAMPNVNDAISFAQDFPGRVFLAHYTSDAKEVVQWTDKAKHKPTVVKAGPLLKFKYSCVLGRFPAISVSLGAWQQGDIVMPDPERLLQMCTSEKTGQIQPEAPARRMISHLTRLIKRFRVTNEETGEGKHEWIYSGGDPHLAHAWVYCNIALERLRRTVIFTFA